MNIDDLVQSIPDSESDLRNQLAHWIDEWKRNEDSIEKLSYLVGKWHGNVWFKETDVSNKFYQDWIQFKAEAIEGINGMTMNERLYTSDYSHFGTAQMKRKNLLFVQNSKQMSNPTLKRDCAKARSPLASRYASQNK